MPADHFPVSPAGLLSKVELPLEADRLPSQPLNVCFVISSLEYGGAERQVIEMVNTFDRTRVKPFICSLSPEVPLAASLTHKEDLVIIEKRHRFDVTTVLRLARLLRKRKVDVVHAFLFDAEIASRLAAPLARVPVVVASERNTDYVRPSLHKMALKLTQPLFDVMVANSHAGKRFNIRTLGLPASRIHVVHNGVDVERFQPDRAAGLGFRRQFNIAPDVPVIGMVGSYKRQKGHDVFLRMAARVRESIPHAVFLIVGEPLREKTGNSNRYETEIRELADGLNLEGCCHFIKNQADMKAVYNACDLSVLLSRHEGTPNVVLESLACGIPVLVTDVADNAIIVQHGENGFVVAPEDSGAAAEIAAAVLLDSVRRKRMQATARALVCAEFSLQRAGERLSQIYTNCFAQKATTACSAVSTL
jgi:glycosyltransferase involved in cell wall biosynthesis